MGADFSGLGVVFLMIIFWIFSIIILGLMLFFIGLRKKPKSTLISIPIGIFGLIIAGPIGGIILLILGFILGLFIFKRKNYFKKLRTNGFGTTVRVISIIGTIIAGILLLTLITKFSELAPNEVKLLLVAIIIPIITILVGISGIIWGSK